MSRIARATSGLSKRAVPPFDGSLQVNSLAWKFLLIVQLIFLGRIGAALIVSPLGASRSRSAQGRELEAQARSKAHRTTPGVSSAPRACATRPAAGPPATPCA